MSSQELSPMFGLNPASTVIVVGAGASKSLGLPTSAELRDLIISKSLVLSFQDEDDAFLKKYGQRRNNFVERFKRCGYLSVDAFCENNNTDQSLCDVGCLELVAHLLPLEYEAIRGNKIVNKWIGDLFRKFFPSSRRHWFTGQLHFITFNYDRLIEAGFFMMFSKLLNDYALAHDLVEKHIRVDHVYGALSHERLFTDACEGNEYKFGFQDCKSSFNKIKLLRNDSDETLVAGLAPVCNAVDKAESVLLLGCGTERINMERIGIIARAKARGSRSQIYGTTYKMAEADIFTHYIRTCKGKWHAGDHELDCEQYISKRVYWKN